MQFTAFRYLVPELQRFQYTKSEGHWKVSENMIWLESQFCENLNDLFLIWYKSDFIEILDMDDPT